MRHPAAYPHDVYSVRLQYNAAAAAPWRDMDAGKRTMMQRMSGRVSGLLDDLSDAISLLNDIMPSKASEQVRPHAPCVALSSAWPVFATWSSNMTGAQVCCSDLAQLL